MSVPSTPNGTVHTHDAHLDDASLGQLTGRMSEQASRLVREELALAQVEAKQKAKRLGLAAGMFGASGMLAFLGLAVAIAAAVLGLATVMSAWLGAGAVGAALILIAGVLVVSGQE